MYCQYCGTKNEDGATYCSECGKPLGSVATESTQTNQQISKKKVKRKINIIGIISGVIVMLGAFLPFISITVLGQKHSFGFMDETDNTAGLLFVALAAISILLSVIGVNIFNIIAGLLSFAIFWSNHSSVIDEFNTAAWVQEASALLQRELGFYCLLVGSIGLIISGIIGMITRRNQKEQLNQ